MCENNIIGKLWRFIKANKTSIFVIFELFWLLFLWVVNHFVPAGIALLIPPTAAFVLSLMMAPVVTNILAILSKKDMLGKKMVVLILYSISYYLTLYLTLRLLQTLVDAFQIDTLGSVQLGFQSVAFLLYIVLFCAFRNPKQLQYWAYAVAYGFFVVWEWSVDWNVAGCTLFGIDTKFALDFFIIPFKEAMLLFIILDTFLKVKDELNQEKRLQDGEKKIR